MVLRALLLSGGLLALAACAGWAEPKAARNLEDGTGYRQAIDGRPPEWGFTLSENKVGVWDDVFVFRFPARGAGREVLIVGRMASDERGQASFTWASSATCDVSAVKAVRRLFDAPESARGGGQLDGDGMVIWVATPSPDGGDPTRVTKGGGDASAAIGRTAIRSLRDCWTAQIPPRPSPAKGRDAATR